MNSSATTTAREFSGIVMTQIPGMEWAHPGGFLAPPQLASIPRTQRIFISATSLVLTRSGSYEAHPAMSTTHAMLQVKHFTIRNAMRAIMRLLCLLCQIAMRRLTSSAIGIK